MDARAVLTVRDDSGNERRFYQQHASKQFQVQHLAEFLHWADQQPEPLTLDTYLAYATAHPDTLPGEDITATSWYPTPRQPGDLDHWYSLVLSETTRSFRYVVCDRHRGHDHDGFDVAEDLTCRADLYAAAARMADELAVSTERFTGGGPPIPGHPTADEWRAHAQQYRVWEQRSASVARCPPAEPDESTGSSNPSARVTAARVTRLIHRHHPGVAVRASVADDGVVTLTVPDRLAADAPWLAHLIGNLLGRRYAVGVRRRSPARANERVSGDRPQEAVRTTLTLRPVAGTEVQPPQTADRDQAEGDNQG